MSKRKLIKGTSIEDLSGLKFAMLTVRELNYDKRKEDEIRKSNGEISDIHWYWRCDCECGNETSVSQSNLKIGRTTSCGCSSKRKSVTIGQKFGRLTVISRNYKREEYELTKNTKKARYFNLKCDCGSEKIVVASPSTLNYGHTLSCGCLIGDKVREASKNKAINGNSIMHFLINKYGEEIANKLVDNEENKKLKLSLYEINRGNSNIHIYINCLETDYHGCYPVSPCHVSDIKNPTGCPYCNSNGQGNVHRLDSLGATDENVHSLWSDKNENSPYEYSARSTQIAWWKCPEGKHEDYQRQISDYVRAKYDCPFCALERKESMLQTKVSSYLKDELGYNLKHEWACSLVPRNPKTKGGNNTMPFDNEVVKLKLIIEVHGEQHYNTCSLNSLWRDKSGLNPEQLLHKRKLYDRYKAYIAYINGYEFLEIPYWTEKDESYKTLIDDKIREILKKRS